MSSKKKNMIISALFLAFGAFLYVQALGIKHMMKNDVGSAFFPKVVGITIMGVALIRLVMALREKESESKKKANSDMLGGWLTILLIGAYVIAFQPVGFLISTAVYLFLQILVLTPKEKRKLPVILAIAVIASVFIWVLFNYVISSPLPKGIFYF